MSVRSSFCDYSCMGVVASVDDRVASGTVDSSCVNVERVPAVVRSFKPLPS